MSRPTNTENTTYSFLTFADAESVGFPPEPWRFFSLRYCLNNLLFSSSNMLFSSKRTLTYRDKIILLSSEKEIQISKRTQCSNSLVITSSSALLRFILRCSFSFSRVFILAANDKTFLVEGLNLQSTKDRS